MGSGTRSTCGANRDAGLWPSTRGTCDAGSSERTAGLAGAQHFGRHRKPWRSRHWRAEPRTGFIHVDSETELPECRQTSYTLNGFPIIRGDFTIAGDFWPVMSGLTGGDQLLLTA
jgi:hypothetical protein